MMRNRGNGNGQGDSLGVGRDKANNQSFLGKLFAKR